MARVTCAISGIRFSVDYLESSVIGHTAGYYHPIFAIPTTRLYQLYYQHTRNNLSPTDSYLLFCAFLHHTGQVSWNHPATLAPNDASTKKLVQNNIAQLISVYERTSIVKHPSFKQPSFVVAYDNAHLSQIHNWILAWEENLALFNTKLADKVTRHNLQAVENRLTSMIASGIPTDKLAVIISEWACQAAEFPYDKEDTYKRVIRSCFNSNKMFNTPLATIKEVKEYCECNIEAGSIHFHKLSEVLKEGISRHVDYLGGSSLALGYTILPASGMIPDTELKGQAELATIASNAPPEPPIRTDYPNNLSYLKARLSYKVAVTLADTNRRKEQL